MLPVCVVYLHPGTSEMMTKFCKLVMLAAGRLLGGQHDGHPDLGQAEAAQE